MFEKLPREVAQYIISILVQHGGTDDVFNLAMSSELLKSHVIRAMGYKMPKHCTGKHGPTEWASLMRGNIVEANIPSEMDSFEKKLEFYALELSTVQKAKINSVISVPHVLPRMPNLISLTLTCDIYPPTNGLNESMLLRQLCGIDLKELVLECKSFHSSTGSKCIQSLIFGATSGGTKQEWQNNTVQALSMSFDRDCAFWNSGNRQILSVFPSTKFLTCLRARLEIPGMEAILGNLEKIHICSNRGSFSSPSWLFSKQLLSKLVTLECNHRQVSGKDLEILKRCNTLKHLSLTLADGAEKHLLSFASRLQSLKLRWGPCWTPDIGPHAFYTPKTNIIRALIETVPHIEELCLMRVKLPCEDLLRILQHSSRRLRYLGLSLEHQALCICQYFLKTVNGLSLHSSQIRVLKFYFCCNGRNAQCHFSNAPSGLQEILSAAVRVLSKHAPLLYIGAVRIAKNRIVRNHTINSA